MVLDLTDKNVLVTGASGGIGEQIVRQAKNAGAGKVIFTYNSKEEEAATIESETGASRLHLNLASRDSVDRFLGLLATTVDYFIANAGMEASGDLPKHDYDLIDRTIRINLTGNAHLIRSAIVEGLLAPSGQIAVVGSIAADGNHNQIAYAAAKAGLRGLVGSLQYDAQVQKQDLGVKLVEPAFVKTPMAERHLKLIERVIKRKGGDPLLAEWRNSGYVMDADYAAARILELTTDPEVIGIRTIPEDADLHALREKYLN